MSYRNNQRDKQFDSWARWCVSGGSLPGYKSIMGKMMQDQGVMTFGSGPASPVIDCVELEIENALSVLAKTNLPAVQIIRFEYGAVNLQGLNASATQLQKANKLEISVRTYRTRLKLAREFVSVTLSQNKLKRLRAEK